MESFDLRHTNFASVAIKMYDKSKFRSDRKMIRQLREECDYMHLMNHPNVTRLFETFSTQRRLYMVMEYVPGGSLIQHMRTEYPERQCRRERHGVCSYPCFKDLNTYINTKSFIVISNWITYCFGQECFDFEVYRFWILDVKDPEQDRLVCGTPAYMVSEEDPIEDIRSCGQWASCVCVW